MKKNASRNRAAKTTGVKKTAGPAKAARPSRPVPRPARKAAGLWPVFGAAFIEAEADAAAATFTALLPASGELGPALAQALGKQFLRASAAPRRRAAKALDAQSLGAAREVLDMLGVYAAVAAILEARGAELAGTHALLEPPAQRKFAATLGGIALAVARERSPADVQVLMAMALDGLLREAPVPKKHKKKA